MVLIRNEGLTHLLWFVISKAIKIIENVLILIRFIGLWFLDGWKEHLLILSEKIFRICDLGTWLHFLFQLRLYLLIFRWLLTLRRDKWVLNATMFLLFGELVNVIGLGLTNHWVVQLVALGIIVEGRKGLLLVVVLSIFYYFLLLCQCLCRLLL